MEEMAEFGSTDAGLTLKRNNRQQIENCVRLNFSVPTCQVVLF
jgi:hypothetical protein